MEFDFMGHRVRLASAEPLVVVATDVCRSIGVQNTADALVDIPGDEKGVTSIYTPGGYQKVLTLTESGLYRLLMRSDKPRAKPFQDWLTKVVVPTIRKDGAYVRGEEKLSDPNLSLSELEQVQEHILALVERKSLLLEARLKETLEAKAQLEAENAVMAPKAAIVDAHVAPRSYDTIARFARTLTGVNSNAVKRDLLRLDYLWRTAGGHYRVRSAHRDTLFTEKMFEENGHIEIFLTEAGKAALVRLYNEGRLTMKIGFEAT
jgi:prophage antirepressor-like protein